jgi:hypothetical protein
MSRLRTLGPCIAVVLFIASAVGMSSATAAPGAQLWVNRYHGAGNDEAADLAVSPGGAKVFVTGHSPAVATGEDYATVAYRANTGVQSWTRRYNGPGNGEDVAAAIAVSQDRSKVFVTGHSLGEASGLDYATVAYSASNGAQLWAARYNGPAGGDDVATALVVSRDSSKVFVTGHSPGETSGEDYATVAYAASTGSPLWGARYDGPESGTDFATDLAVTPDGSKVLVTGDSTGFDGYGQDFATVFYNASTGAPLGAQRFDGVGDSDEYAQSLAVSPDSSRVFVTGWSKGWTGLDWDYQTVAYDVATGAFAWAMNFDGPADGDDYGSEVIVIPGGSTVFVTGRSAGATSGEDYATVFYRASDGAQLLVKTYNGPANADDAATGLGVTPKGSTLFVTGRSFGSATDTDYATVAYRLV